VLGKGSDGAQSLRQVEAKSDVGSLTSLLIHCTGWSHVTVNEDNTSADSTQTRIIVLQHINFSDVENSSRFRLV
jgi:hypothetical protein